jgi:AmmeMemoRadiSam system protein B
VAASGYARLASACGSVERVVLLGPAHFIPFEGLATSSADWFATPLGMVPLDKDAIARVLRLPHVQVLNAAHAPEHSLEVHLPFLQKVLGDFRLVPLLVGEATAEEVAEALEILWGGDETRIVISSDLSHYHDYETARTIDFATSLAIEDMNADKISAGQACGAQPIRGLLCAARNHGLHAVTLDLGNSGDTAGPRDHVVGYGAFVLE